MGKAKDSFPLELMATIPLPTIPTVYPFWLQSTPNLTNSLLIAVEMYVYFIIYPPILITSSSAILNLPINSFCPLDRTLVLISDNFCIQFSLHPLQPFFLFLSLLALTRNCHILCVHIHLFSADWERPLWVRKYIS